VIWADAEIAGITDRNLIVRYAGESARLDRKRLWKSWAFWRGVMFVSSRSGRAAQRLDAKWQDRYGRTAGGVPPVMQMPLAEAIALLLVPTGYTKEDVEAAFRREAKRAHPDVGGTAEQFRQLVEARDRLLAALGTSAPAPKPPTYAPSGVRIVYRRLASALKDGLPRRDASLDLITLMEGDFARMEGDFARPKFWARAPALECPRRTRWSPSAALLHHHRQPVGRSLAQRQELTCDNANVDNPLPSRPWPRGDLKRALHRDAIAGHKHFRFRKLIIVCQHVPRGFAFGRPNRDRTAWASALRERIELGRHDSSGEQD
jgi:anti-sigma-K factor RskA